MKARILALAFAAFGLNSCSSSDMAGVDDTLSKVPIADNSDSSDNMSTEGKPQDFKSDYDMYKNKGYSDSDAYNSAYAADADKNGGSPDTSLVPKPK